MRNLKMMIIVLTITLASAMVANAALIAYEPFDYAPTNNIDGLNGGSGWGESWQGIPGSGRNPCIITAPGMGYTSGDTLYSKGNKGVAVRTNYWDFTSRDFTAPLTGTAGSTNWFSFLCSLQADTNNFGQYIIGFRTEDDESNIRFIANGLGWDTWALNEGGGADYFSTTPFVSNETLFVVIEKINLVNSTQDLWTAWINPPVNQHPTNYTDAFGGVYPAGAISGVHIQKSGPPSKRFFEGYFDEIRVGETWDDVNTDEPILVHTPVNQTPTNFESGVSLTPTLTASAFASDDGADSHSASHFYVESIDGVVVLDTNVGGVVTFTVPGGLLEENTRYFWTVRYKGSHSAKWSTASDLTYFDTTYSVDPTPLAYEGVTYDETTNGIAGYSGGEGWRDNWNPLDGYIFWVSQQDVVSPGLAYRLLDVTNNTFIARNQISGEGRTNGNSRAVRSLKRDGAASLLAQNNHFGGPNMTTWISGLIEAPVGVDPEKNKYYIELQNSAGNYKLRIGKNQGSAFWSVNSSASATEVIPGEAAFLVAKVVYTPSNSVASLWVNPNLGEEPLSNTVSASSTVNNSDYGYDTVALFVQRESGELLPEVKFDEFRIGVNWQQVMPGKPSVIPDTPSNIAPANAAANIPVDGTAVLEGSAFSSEPGDSLLKSVFRIESYDGVVATVTGTTETVTVPAGTLQADTLYSWKVKYFSTLSGLPSSYSVTTAFSTVWSPRDTPIAYDGADYPETDEVEGLNGGYGWDNAWSVNNYYGTNLPMSIEVVSPGMVFDTLPVNGNAFFMDEDSVLTNSSNVRAYRKLKAGDGVNHMMIGNRFGKPGSTNWFSFLAAISDEWTNKNFKVGAARYSSYINAGVQGKYLPESDEVSWSLAGLLSAGANTNIVKTNETAFIVARFIPGSLQETNGSALLWVNPVLSEDEPTIDTAVSVRTNSVAPFDFEFIVAQGNSALISVVTNFPEPGVTNVIKSYEPLPEVKYDEIRFGDSWMGVTGVPEPILGFLALGLILAAVGLRKY